MGDFLGFRKFITPVVIQVLFWLAVAAVVISGLAILFRGGNDAILGLLYIVLGPLVVRIYMEILIVTFRLYDAVHNIEHALTSAARPTMPTAPMGGSFAPSAPAAPAPAAPPAP